MQKNKILHIIKSLGRGGAEMLLPETLKLHNKDSFEFHYIYFLPWKDQMVEIIEQNGGKVTCIQANNNLQLIGSYKKVIKYVKEHHIDLIHCHLPWAGFLGRLVHARTGVPVLYSEHNLQERYHRVTKIINQYSFNQQSRAIAVSMDVSNSIERNINPQIPVTTILNGVNTDTFKRTEISRVREELNIPKDAMVIGNVAVFRFQKRIVEWLQVFNDINEKNSNVFGIIVGAGPLEKEIRSELSRLSLGEKVFLTGLQTNVKPYFEAMDIFMMTSSFEGLPIALLEAMSMECAVISTKAGGIKEVIRNEKDGMLCEVNEWTQLSQLALELINNPSKLNKLKENARKRVQESFSLKTMVDQLERLYQEHTREQKLS